MTKDDIIRAAQEVGLCNQTGGVEGDSGCFYDYSEEIERFFQAAYAAGAAAEREACAKRLEAVGCDHCAANIRLRGNT